MNRLYTRNLSNTDFWVKKWHFFGHLFLGNFAQKAIRDEGVFTSVNCIFKVVNFGFPNSILQKKYVEITQKFCKFIFIQNESKFYIKLLEGIESSTSRCETNGLTLSNRSVNDDKDLVKETIDWIFWKAERDTLHLRIALVQSILTVSCAELLKVFVTFTPNS